MYMQTLEIASKKIADVEPSKHVKIVDFDDTPFFTDRSMRAASKEVTGREHTRAVIRKFSNL